MKKYRFMGVAHNFNGKWVGPILPMEFTEVSNFDGLGVKIKDVASIVMALPLPSETRNGLNQIQGFITAESKEEAVKIMLMTCINFEAIHEHKESFMDAGIIEDLHPETILDEIENNPPTSENIG